MRIFISSSEIIEDHRFDEKRNYVTIDMLYEMFDKYGRSHMSISSMLTREGDSSKSFQSFPFNVKSLRTGLNQHSKCHYIEFLINTKARGRNNILKIRK